MRKFGLFNPDGKKYILKTSHTAPLKQTTKRENLSLGAIFRRISRLIAPAGIFVDF